MMRPTYRDIPAGDFKGLPELYATVERKWDGWYAELLSGPGGWSIHSRSGDVLQYGYESGPVCYLRGEYLDGTDWARRHARCMRGAFMAWDVITWDGEIPRDLEAINDLLDRASGAFDTEAHQESGLSLHVTKPYPIKTALRQWRVNDSWEGLIFRSADGQRYGRMKRVHTVDYICTGTKTQGPCVTALYGGLWRDGVVETVCTVPVRAAAEQASLRATVVIGQVFEARGNGVHGSGALRHPRQAGPNGAVKWRPDKAPEDCKG